MSNIHTKLIEIIRKMQLACAQRIGSDTERQALEAAMTALEWAAEMTSGEPLSMERLQEMDNQPIWVVPMGRYAGNEPGWCVLDMDSKYAGKDARAYIPSCDHWSWPLNEYGTGWLAYYLPPEGEDA